MGAALFGAASAAIGALSNARRVALREALEGKSRDALDRYLISGRTIEGRWVTLRVLGIASSAVLIALTMAAEPIGQWRALLSALAALVLYGIPAEILKAVALRNPERTAPLMLRYLRPFEFLVAPLAAPMVALGRLVDQRVVKTGSIPPDARVTENEVEIIVNQGEETGALGHEASEMIRNVLEFGELTAGEVMVPRTQLVSFDIDTPLSEIVRVTTELGHSRYPVYRERVDNVVGMLHTKDLLSHAANHEGLEQLTLSEVLRRPVAFVPETRAASSVLKDMRAGRHHMAVVIDEFGGLAGIVTLEDLVEEIVGDIRDEHDTNEPPVVELDDGRLLVDAAIPIGDLEPYLGAEMPEDGDYHSLGGFIVDRLGRVPRVGARFVALGHEFVVRDADARRVAKVEIRPPTRPSQPSDPRVTAA
ncbi:MAG: HlyC/CorC family transporter [Myxococcales bacterium]|nr:HlyC/CorC family transporter [Myxococcales bacterium]MCB9577486.1 HlyC/CorC family transporter [Polyangiaceae bacterium]